MNDVGITELEREDEFIQRWVDLEERLKAPAGKYKLVLIDRFEPLFEGDKTIGIFDTLEEAMKARAGEEGEQNSFIEYLIYDDQGYLNGKHTLGPIEFCGQDRAMMRSAKSGVKVYTKIFDVINEM